MMKKVRYPVGGFSSSRRVRIRVRGSAPTSSLRPMKRDDGRVPPPKKKGK